MPDLVVDIGCGTGLSTRYWAGHARQVVGVDLSEDMLRVALAHPTQLGVAYLRAKAHATGIVGGCADFVTSSQALHWMEPKPTLTEVARLLHPGGVFAAYDYDGLPFTGRWEMYLAYREFHARVSVLEEKYKTNERLNR